MQSTIQTVKGTRDFYPDEMSVRSWLYNTVRRVSESFGYQEYDGPFLETIDLYAAKSGEELVKEQAFVFPDRGGDLITLRPELTPSLARMVAQRQKQLIYPIRWWSWGPFWRYERPQKGRSREFFQWNIDLIGASSPQADAEMVAIGATFLRESGLLPQQVRILTNNRKLMEDELLVMGIGSNQFAQIFRLIDKREKMSPAQWDAYAVELGLDSSRLNSLKSLLANDSLWERSPYMQTFFKAVEALGIMEYVSYSPRIIRGLDYYTSTVFETWDRDGEFRSILGGGRYDNLVAAVGGETLPAVGFAMGDMVVSLVLQKFGCIPKNLNQPTAQILVTVFDEPFFQTSINIATQLRQAGINTICYPEAAKLVKQFKFGDRMGMRFAVIIGPDEVASGNVAIKDLRNSEQVIISMDQIINWIRQNAGA